MAIAIRSGSATSTALDSNNALAILSGFCVEADGDLAAIGANGTGHFNIGSVIETIDGTTEKVDTAGFALNVMGSAVVGAFDHINCS